MNLDLNTLDKVTPLSKIVDNLTINQLIQIAKEHQEFEELKKILDECELTRELTLAYCGYYKAYVFYEIFALANARLARKYLKELSL